MIKLLVVDDHTIVRQGIKQILSETYDIEVTGEASTAQDAQSKLLEDDYDVMLLDISMPGRSSLEILQQIKNIHTDLSILVLSMHPEDQYAMRAFKAGASGYLTKNCEAEQLIEAIRKLAQGRKYITPTIAEIFATHLESNNGKKAHDTLSDREYQVMCLLASGKTVSEIATGLSLSVKTISTHKTRLLKKMNMKNNSEIMYYAIKHGMVE